MKRIFSVVFCMILVLFHFSGCSAPEKNAASTNDEATATEDKLSADMTPAVREKTDLVNFARRYCSFLKEDNIDLRFVLYPEGLTDVLADESGTTVEELKADQLDDSRKCDVDYCVRKTVATPVLCPEQALIQAEKAGYEIIECGYALVSIGMKAETAECKDEKRKILALYVDGGWYDGNMIEIDGEWQ